MGPRPAGTGAQGEWEAHRACGRLVHGGYGVCSAREAAQTVPRGRAHGRRPAAPARAGQTAATFPAVTPGSARLPFCSQRACAEVCPANPRVLRKKCAKSSRHPFPLLFSSGRKFAWPLPFSLHGPPVTHRGTVRERVTSSVRPEPPPHVLQPRARAPSSRRLGVPLSPCGDRPSCGRPPAPALGRALGEQAPRDRPSLRGDPFAAARVRPQNDFSGGSHGRPCLWKGEPRQRFGHCRQRIMLHSHKRSLANLHSPVSLGLATTVRGSPRLSSHT